MYTILHRVMLAYLLIAALGTLRLPEVVGASSGDDIRALIDEETALGQKLGSRITALRHRAQNIDKSIAPCSCPSKVQTTLSPERQVAYTGTNQPSLTGLTTSTPLIFSAGQVNIGQPINLVTGHFRAPVSGLYGFSLALYMHVRYWSQVDLVMDNTVILTTKTGHYYSSRYNRQMNMGTNFVIVNATKDAEIWPRYVTGSARIDGEGVTTFSGYLIHEY